MIILIVLILILLIILIVLVIIIIISIVVIVIVAITIVIVIVLWLTLTVRWLAVRGWAVLGKAPQGNNRGPVGSKNPQHIRTIAVLCSAWF